MGFFKEFRKFAMRGNILELAVGIIVGATFGKIVSSLVANVIMPPIGLLIGRIDFKKFYFILKPAEGEIPAVIMEYGIFFQNVFDFIVISFSVFCLIKIINKINKKEVENFLKYSKPTAEEKLLTEIRDIIKNKNNKF